jgi:hypothetical protein
MMRKLAWLFLMGALGAQVSLAQREGRNAKPDNAGDAGAMNEEGTVNVLAALLNLTAPQQQMLHTILDDALASAKPIQKQLTDAQQSVFLAAKESKSDDEIGRLAGLEGLVYAQITSLQARTFAKICRLLTSDQKAQADSSLYGLLDTFLSSQSPEPAAIEKPAEAAPR